MLLLHVHRLYIFYSLSLLQARRESELLRAERNVWQVARGGIQDELSKAVQAHALERQAHEDTRRSWERAQVMR